MAFVVVFCSKNVALLSAFSVFVVLLLLLYGVIVVGVVLCALVVFGLVGVVFLMSVVLLALRCCMGCC